MKFITIIINQMLKFASFFHFVSVSFTHALFLIDPWASSSFSSSYIALQPVSGLGLLFMRFRNRLIDNW
jgi:hypothetical protein